MQRGDEMPAALSRQLGGLLARRVEILTVFDDFGAAGAHRRILFRRVAQRYQNLQRHAGLSRGHRQADAVIAAGGADHAGQSWLAPEQLMHVEQAAANLGMHRPACGFRARPRLRSRGVATVAASCTVGSAEHAGRSVRRPGAVR